MTTNHKNCKGSLKVTHFEAPFAILIWVPTNGLSWGPKSNGRLRTYIEDGLAIMITGH